MEEKRIRELSYSDSLQETSTVVQASIRESQVDVCG